MFLTPSRTPLKLKQQQGTLTASSLLPMNDVVLSSLISMSGFPVLPYP